MRSSVAAFGFVYIHPLADGNGRVHRFLINDILRRDGATPDPLILPVSSLINHEPAERRAYNRILDNISRPLMQTVREHCEFVKMPQVYPDGVSSNFVFHGNHQARHAWRFLDLSAHVPYLAHVLERVICEEMREESNHLRSHLQARRAIRDVIEMPDVQLDRVIRSVQNNQGQLSGVLAKEIPALQGEGVWEAVRQAVQHAFRSIKP